VGTPRQSPRLAARRAAQDDTADAAGIAAKPSPKLDTDHSKNEKKAPNMAKLYVRGCVTNGVGSLLLYACATGLDIVPHVSLAAGIQLAVYLFHGLPCSSERFYDLSGSFTHFSLVAYAVGAEPRVRTARQVVIALFSVVWMTRLGTFLYARIQKDGKDERFDAIKPCWLSFLGAWTLQACWVTLIQLPIVLINNRDDTIPLGPVDVLALGLWIVGFVFEFCADIEKATFRADPANKSRFITTGTWALSRHPNYFGEILMWAAMAICVSWVGWQNGDTVLLWAWGSPAFTAALLLKVSGVPMVEKAGEKKWGNDPEYRHYMDNTSCVMPWFPAKPKGC